MRRLDPVTTDARRTGKQDGRRVDWYIPDGCGNHRGCQCSRSISATTVEVAQVVWTSQPDLDGAALRELTRALSTALSKGAEDAA